jgi:hypothetical protein
VLLILLGAWFLALQLVPEWQVYLEGSWPLIVIGVGVMLLAMGALTGVPHMAIPACIVGGIGVLLFWQNLTGNWESWAYAWTLIIGFVGVGILLAGWLGGRAEWGTHSGGTLIVISLVMFLIFGSFLGGPQLGPLWPILLIVFGLWLIARPLLRARS